jgi:hypothetical protein
MTKKKTPATAEQSFVIESPRTTRIHEGGKQHTALIYRGDAPEVGQVLRFVLANGVTYQGKVKDFTDTDGEILAEFSDGLRPVTTK